MLLFFPVVLAFELRVSCLLDRCSYSLSHSTCPGTILSQNLTILGEMSRSHRDLSVFFFTSTCESTIILIKISIKKHLWAKCRWLTLVILATQEAGIRRIKVWSQPGQLVCENLSRKKNPSQKRTWWSGSRCRPCVQTPVSQKKKVLLPTSHPRLIAARAGIWASGCCRLLPGSKEQPGLQTSKWSNEM
jgi:hypothetical protein